MHLGSGKQNSCGLIFVYVDLYYAVIILYAVIITALVNMNTYALRLYPEKIFNFRF